MSARAVPPSAARAAAALLACLVLAGCAGRPVREAPPVAADAAMATQVAREAALAADPAWALAGRVALANGSRGGSGRMEWRQGATGYQVALSAPVTRQSWRLRVDGQDAVIEGLDGGPRQGPDAALLLARHTGWEVPVHALPAWLRGARDPALGAATLAFGDDGRLARMEQAGWAIEYSDWRLPEAGLPGVALPHRLEAVRGEARVRLVVDAWAPGGTGP